jgi:imidazolonepropionase-like amidohydrolase
MKTRIMLVAALCGLSLMLQSARAADEKELPQTLFQNVNIFNGTEDKLYENHQVLVEGNLIKAISASEIETRDGATVIDGGGRTLMPGMIDGHAHVMINAHFDTVEKDMDLTDLAYRAKVVVERFLLDGFTSVRDMGGPAFGLRRWVARPSACAGT